MVTENQEKVTANITVPCSFVFQD